MEIYTLTPSFVRDTVLGNKDSVVWTERYTSPGDIQLVVPDTTENRLLLTEGTFLATPGSDEVMLIDTLAPESKNKKKTLTATGSTITGIFEERLVHSDPKQQAQTWLRTLAPGAAMKDIADFAAIGASVEAAAWLAAQFPYEDIPNVTFGAVDTSGAAVSFSLPFGSALSLLTQIAETYAVGFKLYLESADESGYSLKFLIYRGADRTSAQSLNPVVRFSESMGTLTDVSELRSIKGYKTAAYAWAPSLTTEFTDAHPVARGEAYVSGPAATETGFARRTLSIMASDIQENDFGVLDVDGHLVDPAAAAVKIHDALVQRAKDGLANNNYVHVVDGTIVPQAFTYGSDFWLGDIVELEAADGDIGKARITEYIRSQDSTGEKAYPTISVI